MAFNLFQGVDLPPRPSMSSRHSTTDSEDGSRTPRLQADTQMTEVSKRDVRRIDREKVTPMFLKMFCRIGGHHRLDEYENESMMVEDELIVYTWYTISLSVQFI